MKKKLRIGIGKIIALIVLLIILILYLIDQHYPMVNELVFVRTAPKEYWNLFPENTRKKLIVSVTDIPKLCSPISQFTYDNEKFFIEVFKIDTLNHKSLTDFITLSSVNNLKIEYVPFYPMGSSVFEDYYRIGRHKASHLNVNLFGGPITTIVENDTIAAYNSEFKIFSIKYDNSDTSSIYATTERNYPEIPTVSRPIDIMFIKKDKKIYLLLMSVTNSKINLPPDLLYNLILGNG